jgi:hypothetical protein
VGAFASRFVAEPSRSIANSLGSNVEVYPRSPEASMRLARMIQAVDAHACGEPGRVIVGGVLDVPGRTMSEKMRHLQNHADGLRKLMLR